MALWTNSDGLRVKLGNTEAEVGRGGLLNTFTGDIEYEFVIDLANAADASALVPDTDNIVIPTGFVLREVQVTNEVAATGANATLNLGLVRSTDYSTAYDIDGILVAAPRTDWDAVGETKLYQVGVTGIGALAGVATATYPTVLVYDYETAAFTAGRIRVVIRGNVLRPAASH